MVQESEDPTGMNRGAKTTSHVNDSPTHTNGSGGAQEREWAEYYSPASHQPEIEAIAIRPGVVNIYNVKLCDVGTVSVEAEQLADFRRFNCACIAQVQRCFDPPPSELVWNRHIDAALRKAIHLERIGETPAPCPRSQEKSSAQFVLKKALAEALDQRGMEVKPDGNEDMVRAVCEADVRVIFEARYLATHADTSDVGQAWRRALKHPVVRVMKGTVNGVPYLWRLVP
jgi:hypothetical protein